MNRPNLNHMALAPKESIYSALDLSKSQIRLFHLQPRCPEDDSKIKCSLHLANLDDESCLYKALSYEWGDSTNVTFEGWIDNHRVPVRKNLWLALWQLRDENGVEIFWVDAICINQDNVYERNHQVKQMKRIYETAQLVVVWIGMPGNSISEVATVTKALSSVSPLSIQLFGDPQTQPTYAGLSYLCSRSYWSRLWILQENILAKEAIVKCGEFEIMWKDLEAFFKFFENDVRRFWVNANIWGMKPFKIYQQRQRRLRDRQSHTIYELCVLYWNSQCIDPRDKVFGLLGLSRSCCQISVPADYTKSPTDIVQILLRHQFFNHIQDQQIPDMEDEATEILFELGSILRSLCVYFPRPIQPRTWRDVYNDDIIDVLREPYDVPPGSLFAILHMQRNASTILELTFSSVASVIYPSKYSNSWRYSPSYGRERVPCFLRRNPLIGDIVYSIVHCSFHGEFNWLQKIYLRCQGHRLLLVGITTTQISLLDGPQPSADEDIKVQLFLDYDAVWFMYMNLERAIDWYDSNPMDDYVDENYIPIPPPGEEIDLLPPQLKAEAIQSQQVH